MPWCRSPDFSIGSTCTTTKVIGTIRKGGQRQIVTRSDVQVVNVSGGGQPQPDAQPQGDKKPRILHIIDNAEQMGLSGFYIRIPKSAFRAYGDLLPECDSRGVVWAGNKFCTWRRTR